MYNGGWDGSSFQFDWCTYRSARLIVVKIHLLAKIATTFAGVHELARELEAEANVIRASAPFPVPNSGHTARLMIGLWWARLVAVIAGAGLNAALAAGTSYRMGHSGTRDCIDEARLTAACKKHKREREMSQCFVFCLPSGCSTWGQRPRPQDPTKTRSQSCSSDCDCDVGNS